MQNLFSLVNAIREIGENQPNVNTVVLSNIFELNSRPDINYSVFAITQDQHRQDDNYFYYSFYLYYVDRLLNDRSNQLEIQSTGIQLLSNILDDIEDLGVIINPEFERTYQTFTQRFSDETAGVYVRLELMVPVDCMIAYDILVNPKLANLAVYQPGTYYPSDYGADGFRVVDVSGQSYQYYTENEEDKTAKIDNEYHNIEVNKSGATYDGYQIVNTNILSAYTYSKNETDDRISQTAIYYYNQLEPRVTELSGLTSANTSDIVSLSAITSGLSDDIATLSGMTGDFVKKDPINVEGTQQNPIDFNDLTAETGYYYVRVNNSYAINHPVENGWLPDGMLEVVRDPDSIRITQVFTANFGTIQAGDWPRRWYRVYCYLAEGQWGWTGWNEVANKGDIKTLSGLTSANTQNITALSAQTNANTEAIATISAVTGDWIEKTPKPITYSGTTIDFNDFTTTGYYVFRNFNLTGNSVNYPNDERLLTADTKYFFLEVLASPPVNEGDDMMVWQQLHFVGKGTGRWWARSYGTNDDGTVGWGNHWSIV